MSFFVRVWNSYSAHERRNIGIYILGIMFYKFGLEFFNGSITTLASDRFKAASTFTKLGAAQGVNQAAQCVGAILIAPLIKRWPTRSVLACAILFFGLMTTILLIVDAGTGGSIRASPSSPVDYGSWNPNAIFVVWTFSGIAYGMVELIRRVIPADIVGGHVGKLRRMDATVHIFYEVAGTAGAFASSSAISRFGNNYSFFMTPVFFAFAGLTWAFVSSLGHSNSNQVEDSDNLAAVDQGQKRRSSNYIVQVGHGVIHFAQSVYLGARLVFLNRSFIWLFPGYALALYLHRFLENSVAPAFAKRTLGISAWSQIMVGCSNLGELLGAVTVFMLSDVIPTPLPWLRLDALLLNLVWVLPHFAGIARKDVSWAWRTGGICIAISYGWAAGDVSLAAYIQAAVKDKDFGMSGVSALGAVMAFLYSSYIVIYAILSVLLGKIVDSDFAAHGNIISALRRIGGIQFSVCSGIIILACFIPKGAFAMNPKIIGDIRLEGESGGARSSDEVESEGRDSDEIKDMKGPDLSPVVGV